MSAATPNALGRALRGFFVEHLPGVRGLSPHTVLSYRDALALFLRFLATYRHRPVVDLDLDDLDPDCVIAFLDHLEKDRGNCAATRNARLAALHALVRYVAPFAPEYLATCQRLLAVPFKRAGVRVVEYLEGEELRAMLAAADRGTREGRRDHTILLTLLNTGARVQELLDIRPADLQLERPLQVRLCGKGRKERFCPLWPHSLGTESVQIATGSCGRRQSAVRTDISAGGARQLPAFCLRESPFPAGRTIRHRYSLLHFLTQSPKRSLQRMSSQDVLSWLKNHKQEWHPVTPAIQLDLERPESFLGEEGARDEWSGDPPTNIFTPIATYDTLQEVHSLFLFGRRGTGKTALLHMLQHQVRQGHVGQYRTAWLLQTDVICDGLSTLVNGSTLATLSDREQVRFLVQCWQWLAKHAALASVLADHHSWDDETMLNQIRTYLDFPVSPVVDQSKSFSSHAIKRLMRIVTEQQTDTDERLVAKWLSRVNAALDDQELHAAIAAMQALLQSRRGPSLALVMLDGDEVIEIHDRVAWNVFVALIEAVNDCYTERSLTGMIMKAAFPSELYPHLHPNNKDRVESRNVFISWRYRDLVSFLAKRFMRLIHRDAAEVDYAKLDEFHPAQAFLYSILPAETATKRGLSFDTIAYVVRHSQKKPRQLLTIMNAVLTYARERGLGATQLSDTSDVIRTGVHRRLDILVDGALDSYSRIYPNAARLVRDTLFKAQAYFEYGELDRLVGQHAALRETGGLSRDQHKSLLIECGALGTASVVSPLQDGKYWLVEAQFEYQVKGLISLSPQQICVVHPMFYDALGTTIDSNVLVYPVPKEDDERETLLKRGIQLAVNHID